MSGSLLLKSTYNMNKMRFLRNSVFPKIALWNMIYTNPFLMSSLPTSHRSLGTTPFSNDVWNK